MLTYNHYTTMPPQSQPDEITPEDAKASMGIATFLQDQMMPQAPEEQPQNGSQSPEMAPEQPQQPQVDPEAITAEVEGKVMKEVKSLIKEEIGGIKDMLKEALDEEENTDK